MAEIRNRLKTILQEKGIDKFSPTAELLKNKFGNMTRHRFFKILENRLTTNSLSSDEQFYIEKRLHDDFCIPKDQIQLIEIVKEVNVLKKHNLS